MVIKNIIKSKNNQYDNRAQKSNLTLDFLLLSHLRHFRNRHVCLGSDNLLLGYYWLRLFLHYLWFFEFLDLELSLLQQFHLSFFVDLIVSIFFLLSFYSSRHKIVVNPVSVVIISGSIFSFGPLLGIIFVV